MNRQTNEVQNTHQIVTPWRSRIRKRKKEDSKLCRTRSVRKSLNYYRSALFGKHESSSSDDDGYNADVDGEHSGLINTLDHNDLTEDGKTIRDVHDSCESGIRTANESGLIVEWFYNPRYYRTKSLIAAAKNKKIQGKTN